MKANELKSLQVKHNTLQKEYELLNRKVNEFIVARDKCSSSIARVNEEIQALSAKDIVVSEHALLRYAERVMNIDFEEVGKNILGAEELITTSKTGLNSFTVVTDEFKIIVKNRTIVSIV